MGVGWGDRKEEEGKKDMKFGAIEWLCERRLLISMLFPSFYNDGSYTLTHTWHTHAPQVHGIQRNQSCAQEKCGFLPMLRVRTWL